MLEQPQAQHQVYQLMQHQNDFNHQAQGPGPIQVQVSQHEDEMHQNNFEMQFEEFQ